MKSWVILIYDNNMTKRGRITNKDTNLISIISSIKQKPSGNNNKTMIIFRKKWGVTREINKIFTSTMSNTPEEHTRSKISRTPDKINKNNKKDLNLASDQRNTKDTVNKIKAPIWVLLISFSVSLLSAQ